MAQSTVPSGHGNLPLLSNTRRKVRIVGKIRGFLESEIKSSNGSSLPWISVQKSAGEAFDKVRILCRDQTSSSKEYKLDWCYEHHEDIPQIFSREVKPLIPGVFHGHNASVIAYGARGSGKTYMIQGSEEKPGLATLAMSEILSSCEETGSSVKISYYEVFHDHVYDLLEPKEQEVSVWEDNGGQIQLKGISQVHVKSISEFNKFYFDGCNQRSPAQKVANDVVRRSHKGLIIYVCSSDKDSNISLVGKMNFVDLAGYEDIRRISLDIPHLTEFPRINKSLYAVENVVRALNANERRVPFRDTKLTRILQDSIGGTSRALMITCLNPTFCQDTIHVISWASRSSQAGNLTCNDSTQKFKSQARPVGSSSVPGSTPQCLTSTKKLGSSLFRSTEKKTIKTPHGTKERNLINLSRPIKSSQQRSVPNVAPAIEPSIPQKENSISNVAKAMNLTEEESITLSNVKSLEDLTLDEENSLSVVTPAIEPNMQEEKFLLRVANPIEPLTPKQDVCTQDDVRFDRKPLTRPEEGYKMGNSPVNVERSQPISARLREITNTLKALSTPIPLSMKTPNTDNICSSHACKDFAEPITPGIPFNLRVNDNWEAANASTPGETFKSRSCGLKKSLVQEYLKFLNSASKEELKEVKGIGEKRASYILELREESPEPFKNLDDLKEIGLSSKQVNGIMRQVAGQLFR